MRHVSLFKNQVFDWPGCSLLVGIIRLQLLLQGKDLVIPLIQAPSQRYHDVPLLQQQLLVSVNLHATPCASTPALCSGQHLLKVQHNPG